MENSILIVDDQKGVRRLLEEVFKKDKWHVYSASNGREAIIKAQEFKPDIILMDMKMPVMDGLEAAQEILARQEQDIIMMTAYGEMDIVNQIMAAGVMECVTKPFDIFVVRELVRSIVMNKVS